MKVRSRKGRSGWAEKRLRQIEAEQETIRDIQADRKRQVTISRKRSGYAMAEWNRNKARYSERFGSYKVFKEVYSANFDNAMSLGKNYYQAKFVANKALRNAIKTKEELNAEKRKKDYKGISKIFWKARKEQGGIGSGKFSFNGFVFDRYDSSNGSRYMVFKVNEDWEYWDPISPNGNSQSHFVYVGGATPEDVEERADVKVKETSATEEVFDDSQSLSQGLVDDELDQAIADTFGGMSGTDTDVASDVSDIFNESGADDNVYSHQDIKSLTPIPLSGTTKTQKITSNVPPAVSPIKAPGGLSNTASRMKQPEPPSNGNVGLGILGALASIKPSKRRRRKKKK